MKKTILIAGCMLCIGNIFAQTKKPQTPVKTTKTKPTAIANPFKSNTDSASYALGVRIAQNLKNSGFDKLNLSLVQKAMADVLQHKKLLIEETALDECIGKYQQKAAAEKAIVVKQAGRAFLAANGKRTGVTTLPNGLQYEIMRAGKDTTRPTLKDKVKCHYHGTLIDGKVFDSSVDRGEPASFSLNRVIRGWQEALQLMTIGSKWKLYIPADLAYGDNAAGTIPPGSTLIFEVELLGIEK
jgi:FKBP-type peptidyl-prolyl cis-trans isomerase FklB